MGYEVISDFRGGLDARKYKLSLPPGTLTALVNGHITQGGEIEKRKAFVPTTVPAGTYGACPVPLGIMKFGSVTPASIGADATGMIATGIYYQQLTHPDGATAMTSVVSSTLLGDYPFVVAQFGSDVFSYYNGVLVSDFTAGLVMTYLNTNAKISGALTAVVNASGNYTAIQDASPNDNELDVFSLPGNSYSALITIASLCNLTITTTDDTSFTGATITSTNGNNAGTGTTFNIGGKAYTFRAALTPTEGEVLIGATIGATMTNLFNAINHTGTPNTDYKCAAQNANVYAQNLNTANTPTFQVVARVANTQSEVINTIAGVNYETDAPTVNKALPIQAIGQFKISAINPQSTSFASANIKTNGTNPGGGSSLTINGVVYTFIVTPASPFLIARQVKIGANLNATFDNLISCINATPAGSGVVYGSNTTANAYVTASARTGSGSTASFNLTAKTSGAGGNYALASADGRISVPATLTGGASSAISGITVGAIFASGTLTTNGTNPSNHDTVTIGSQTYRFCTTLVDGLTNDIQIGANAATTLQNLIQAINGSGIQNFDYIIANPNPQVTALPSLTSNVLQVNARVAGAAGNAIALVIVSGTTLTVSGATLAGGSDTVQLLAGIVNSITGQSTADFTLSVSAAINANSAISGYSSNVVGNTIYITSVASNSFSNKADITVTVPTGNLVAIGFCAFEFSYGLAATGGVLNTNGGMSGGVSAGGVQIDGQSVMTNSHGFTSTTTIASMCAAMAADINNAQNLYVCVAIGSRIYLSKYVTSSADSALTVAINTSGNSANLGVSQVGQDGLVAVTTPGYISFVRSPTGGTYFRGTFANNFVASGGLPYGAQSGVAGAIFSSGLTTVAGAISNAFGLGKTQKEFTASYSPIVATCKPTGGYPPYKFLWQKQSGADGFTVSDPTAQSVTFARPDTAGADTAYWVCTVTDSLNNFVDSNFVKVHQP